MPGGSSKIQFVDKILDNVHGFIPVTKAELAIMNTQLFKRLQSIKQLSVANWIFPGSEHTRFIHSLGVMHIADRMAMQLKLPIKQRKILRLAGLLHDIGHYPLSHVCESPYRYDLITFDEANYCQSVNKQVLSDIDTFQIVPPQEYMTDSKGCHHEAVGASIIQKDQEIRKIIMDECGATAIDDICDIIVGKVRKGKDATLVQLIHSELDADGIDYLLRDAAFSGTSFGTFELDQLILNLTLCKYGDNNIVCVKPQGIAAADQYLINKFFSYSQVVYNKHVSNLEWMAEQIVDWMQKGAYSKQGCSFPSKKDFVQSWLSPKNSYTEYLAFTDNYFWSALRDIVENPAVRYLPSFITTFADQLLHHNELEYIDGSEVRIVSDDAEEIKHKLMESSFYTKLSATTDDAFAILQKRTMTKQIPERDFKKKLATIRPNETEKHSLADADAIQKQLMEKRLMECICVLDGGSLHLLCDDPRSLMRKLYNSTLVVMRAFKFPK